MSQTKSMYVRLENGFYILRQHRFKYLLDNKHPPHPWDVCAVARSVEEMHKMVDKHWPNDIDYSLVEEKPNE